MKHIRRLYRDLPIRRKIIFIYMPLSLIPLLLFAFMSTRVYEASIIDRTFMTANDNSQLIIEQVESYLDDASDSATLLTININNATNKYESGVNSALTLFNGISNELTYSLLVFPNLDSIAYIDVNGQLHTTDNRLSINRDKVMASQLVQDIESTTGTDLWFSMTMRDYLVTDASQPVLTLGKKIISINSGETLGYLFINIVEPKVSESFINQETHYFILDQEDTIIASNTPEELLMDRSNHALSEFLQTKEPYQSVIEPENQTTQLISVTMLNQNRWRLVGSADLAYLTSDLAQVNLYTIMLLAAIFIVIIFSLNLLSAMLTRPIKDLTLDMKKIADGDFDVVHNYDSSDEIGTLTKGFNHMSSEIKELLDRVQLEQKKKREYELALIQEQIKPHFLYNCLDAIYALSMMGRQKDAARTTKALADYYRLSLSKGHDIISLRDEIANVTNYLEIQKIRYADVFDYTIDISPSILDEKILKLTLQPIVENAIYHGLKPTEQMGHINLKSIIEEENLYIVVQDNGKGIEQDIMDTLLTKPSKEKHFALYNVQDRMQLFFGPEYGINISSFVGEGTTVTIKLPYRKENTL